MTSRRRYSLPAVARSVRGAAAVLGVAAFIAALIVTGRPAGVRAVAASRVVYAPAWTVTGPPLLYRMMSAVTSEIGCSPCCRTTYSCWPRESDVLKIEPTRYPEPK